MHIDILTFTYYIDSSWLFCRRDWYMCNSM